MIVVLVTFFKSLDLSCKLCLSSSFCDISASICSSRSLRCRISCLILFSAPLVLIPSSSLGSSLSSSFWGAASSFGFSSTASRTSSSPSTSNSILFSSS